MGLVLILGFLCIFCSLPSSNGYDPLDPNGNVTIKWDLLASNSDSSTVSVSITNYQLYRHLDEPGWKLSWTWTNGEVIYQMWGAEATEQGNCSKYRTQNPLPHCCEPKPVIVDLLPGAPYNVQYQNCCKGGVLTSMLQDPSKYGAAFQMAISGGTGTGPTTKEPTDSSFVMPVNFFLGIPGYTCSNGTQVQATRIKASGGRRWTQVLATWEVTCMYSQFLASTAPKCCVSLSAFYNSTIVPCKKCSCGCRGLAGTCVKPGDKPPPPLQEKLDSNKNPPEVIECTSHMCPIRVHWHVKQSYTKYWRVKVTITNFNYMRNYSQWSLVLNHPNLNNVNKVFSFNFKPLNQYGSINDSALLWGLEYYNNMLLQAGDLGNVQSELLMGRDPNVFTFSQGWAFPRRIIFNGDECVMPDPDEYPNLPNNGRILETSLFVTVLSLTLVALMFLNV